MRVSEAHLEAIQSLGYTTVEARFLCIAAAHSGYFVPRQFLAFANVRWGKRTTHFTRKLQSRGHVSWRELPGIGGVFHVFSKAIYDHAGLESLRNRRQHSTEFIRTRLVILDFVLRNLEYEYLVTESEKLQYFCDHLKVPSDILPTKSFEGGQPARTTRRYFVDKFPLFLDRRDPSRAPLISFAYVDPGYVSLVGFVHHLQCYAPLLHKLDAFRFFYIANCSTHLARARTTFENFFRSANARPDAAELLRYFELRQRWEDKRYSEFSAEDLESLQCSQTRFHDDRSEALYHVWLQNSERSEESRNLVAQNIDFQTVLVNEIPETVSEGV